MNQFHREAAYGLQAVAHLVWMHTGVPGKAGAFFALDAFLGCQTVASGDGLFQIQHFLIVAVLFGEKALLGFIYVCCAGIIDTVHYEAEY